MHAEAVDPRRRWWGLAVLSVTQLLIGIDLLIMLIALPSIETDLKMSAETGQWVITAYALTFGALLLLGGRIADYGGRKRAFMIGLVGFAIASALGGLAGSSAVLFAARAAQGACAALLVPTSLSLINVMFTSAQDRSRALAVYGAVAGSGVGLGMLFGGIITEYLSWRWCLLVNPPVCVLAFIGGKRLLVESRVAGRPRYDALGAITGSAGIALLVFGFAHAGTDGWGDAVTLAALVAASVLTAVFIVVETRVDQPLLPLHLILAPARAGALLVQLLGFAGLMGVFLFLNYYLQDIKGYSAVQCGLALLPYATAAVIGAAVLEKPLGRLPRVIPIAGGAAGMALVALWFGFIDLDWEYATHILPALVLLGLCVVVQFIAASAAVLDDAPADDSGVCSALFSVAQQLGIALGPALLTTIAVQATASAADGARPSPADLVTGYGVGALVGAGVIGLGAGSALLLIRLRPVAHLTTDSSPAV